ncbi:hypothetical protein SAMD00019534_066150 [Acytostelium subglobosum LB1]|uniref:hypothetical protein n=1 Tax=Acytostelium subglobosum LB1 TaxID=1410327 RepID=UPI0006447D41|nr:hypothetical protein SAMD00019534_066150 [Acytostelium subglobosum LB1]GAM23440.1 hypothetical protein SAMD00019534_066150 [Acytostelium subglobosum LB1]|eukprot:XP_012753889.1 hypothetical protein SAMD00019534_066150 [Acytostelium subglobosum LB1]
MAKTKVIPISTPKFKLRKIVLNNSQWTEQNAKASLMILEDSILAIQNKSASRLSYEELYRNAYKMVTNNCGPQLYAHTRSLVQKYLAQVTTQLAAGDSHGEAFLTELSAVWSHYRTHMLMVCEVLAYLNMTYVPKAKLTPLYDMGLDLFRELVVNAPTIQFRLVKTLLAVIHKERDGEIIDQSSLKDVVNMLLEVSASHHSKVYESVFETPFIEASTNYFQLEAQNLFSSSTCSDYLKKVEQRIKEETERVAHYVNSSTESKMKILLEKIFIGDYVLTLSNMESGVIPMFREDKFDDLRRMHSMFGRTSHGVPTIYQILRQHLMEVGKSIVTDEEKSKESGNYFMELLELKDKCDKLHKYSFNFDNAFRVLVDQEFIGFINKNQRSPEFMSLLLDDKLKKGFKGASDEEIDELLDRILELFNYIEEKDVFEKYYKQHLAKRLLLGRSVSDDTERNMISKLKTICGYQFTMKLEGMFTDVKVSIDTCASFKQQLERTERALPFELNVNVLTTGFWPIQGAQPCKLPADILLCCDMFRTFYLRGHSGRILTWQTNLGTAELRAKFGNKSHELQVSTPQMIMLLLFNDVEQLTFKQLEESSGLSAKELQKNLLALTNSKNKVLDKEPSTKTVSTTDVFKFNAGFKSKLFKVKIMSVAQKDTVVEVTETREKIEEERKHLIEACIVRIMKSRKTLDHANLVSEVTSQMQSRFIPNPLMVKKRIESLIEREYLERTKEDKRIYNYLA